MRRVGDVISFDGLEHVVTAVNKSCARIACLEKSKKVKAKFRKFDGADGVNEVELETKEVKIVIRTGKQAAPVVYQSAPQQQYMQAPVQQNMAIPALEAVAPVAATPATTAASAAEAKYITIKSPMIGTFYRSAGPDKDAFVNVGSSISAGTTLCIIEAMKLFNEIESEVSGKIVKVLVDDASPVEYDQPLFLVDPS
jgi:acetyl-CoA carboxylase biotin carboxyl carrier protein